MKKRLPPLNWLRAFEASARHLNFTQAAAELHMTQAAISQQIKGLESSLGYALFTRLPRGLSLTDAGKSYIPAVKEAIEKLAVATDEIFGQTRGKMLSIRVNPVFYNAWLAPKLADQADVLVNRPSCMGKSVDGSMTSVRRASKVCCSPERY